MVISAGEDGYLKIWDVSFQLKHIIDVKQSISIKDLKNPKCYGLQSIDIYACDRQSANSTATVKIMAGIRSGEVVECLMEHSN